ncbi:MAG: hypothetical protein D6730_14685 [Bacteroidetes bacterium]|nr:MAG: hypothetical protein D6730_14685 [Bacteroidota bacterium]
MKKPGIILVLCLLAWWPAGLHGQKTFPVKFERNGLIYEGEIEVQFMQVVGNSFEIVREVNGQIPLTFARKGQKLKVRMRRKNWPVDFQNVRVQIRPGMVDLPGPQLALDGRSRIDIGDGWSEMSFTVNSGGKSSINIDMRVGRETVKNVIQQSYNIIIEQEEWESAQRVNSLQAYQDYLRAFPNGQYKARALDAMDELSWTAAVTSNEPAAYRKYRRDFPRGKHFIEAGETLISMDKIDWQLATSRATRTAFELYLKRHPDGLYRAEAEDVLATEDYDRYLNTPAQPDGEVQPAHPGPNRPPKESRPPTSNPLTAETAAWKEAERKHTIFSYQQFIQDFPNSPRVSTAETRINDLKEALRSRLSQPITSRQERVDDRKFRVYLQEAEYPVFIEHIQVLDDSLELARLKPPFMEETDTTDLGSSFLYNWRNNMLVAEIHKDSMYMDITVSDKLKYKILLRDIRTHEALDAPVEKTHTFTVDASVPRLQVIEFRPEGDTIRLSITGGVPPYQLQLMRQGETFVSDRFELLISEADTSLQLNRNGVHKHSFALDTQQGYAFVIPFAQLDDKLNGEYVLNVTDSRRTESVSRLHDADMLITIERPQPFAWLWLIELLLFVLIAGWLVYRFVQIHRLYAAH